jgi:hypothetical protein
MFFKIYQNENKVFSNLLKIAVKNKKREDEKMSKNRDNLHGGGGVGGTES